MIVEGMMIHTPRLLALISAVAALGAFTPLATAQISGEVAPNVTFCDPLLSIDRNRNGDDEEDFEELHRYDLEKADRITDRDAIANALFEERWNLQTGQSNPRYELCPSQQSFVVHWADLFDRREGDSIHVKAEGLLSFQRDGTFEYVYADRPYRGAWSLVESDIVLEAGWLNDGAPLRSAVELVQTPVEVTYEDGRTDTYVEEHLRLGWFRLFRIATTEKGQIRKCAC